MGFTYSDLVRVTKSRELEGKKREERFEELLKNPGEELKVADQEEVQL